MSIQTDLKNIKTIPECSKYLSGILKNFTTLYSKVYSDYENKDFTKQIKAYQYKGLYMITISDIDNRQVTEMTVCLTNKKPKVPHPVFPIMASYAPNSVVYHFKAN